MIEDYYKQFAETLLYLSPRFPLDAEGVAYHIKTSGLESFVKLANGYDEGILESVELLMRLGKGGKPDAKR